MEIIYNTGEARVPLSSRARVEPEQHLRNWQAQGSCPRLTAGPQRPLVCLPLTLASSSVDVRKCWTHRAQNTAPDGLRLVEQTGGEREQEAMGPGAQGRCSARDSPTMPGASAHPGKFLQPGTKRNSLPPVPYCPLLEKDGNARTFTVLYEV